MKWQPIETAPKDGTSILGFQLWSIGPGWCVLTWTEWGEHVDEAGLTEIKPGWTIPEDHYATCWEPTHWMPLPEPPEGERD